LNHKKKKIREGEEALHGLMIGDGHITRTKTPSYTQTFGRKFEVFANHIYSLFRDFCSPSGLYTYEVHSGKNSPFYRRWIVSTLVSTEFHYFCNLYYTFNDLGERIKIIPSNIKSIITPVALAYLVMSDGNFHKTHGIIRLYTNCYTKTEVQLLSNAILDRYGISSRVERDRKEQYIIVIRKTEVPNFQAIVKPYILPSFLYRIGL
jgi:hypothetical protein